MDPAEERRETKRQTELINMQGYVADSEYGIPTRCPCGGRIIDDVRGKDDYDTLPGKRFFTCKNYKVSASSQLNYFHLIEFLTRFSHVFLWLTRLMGFSTVSLG